MDRIAIENTGDGPVWVGGAMIPAGETRHFDVAELPPDYAQASAAPVVAAPDPLAELLAGNVASVVAALTGLSDADLAQLWALEAATERPRKGVLEAVAAEDLRRATARVEDGGA